MADGENNPGASAAFKLSTLETIGADPLMRPIDHSLMGAYLKFMKWPTRTAYLTNLKARIMTGGKRIAQSTITRSRARLVKMGYLRPVTAKLNGAILYEINNPRLETVSDQVVIAHETLKEWDAQRKVIQRRCRVSKMSGTEPSEGKQNLPDRVSKMLDNSLEHSFQEEAPREDGLQQLSASRLVASLAAADLGRPTERAASQRPARTVGLGANAYLMAKEGR